VVDCLRDGEDCGGWCRVGGFGVEDAFWRDGDGVLVGGGQVDDGVGGVVDEGMAVFVERADEMADLEGVSDGLEIGGCIC
jgi:hypothetical protein